MTDFVSSVPPEIVAQNLTLTLEEVGALPQKEAYFAAGIVPDEMSSFATARPDESDIELTSFHRYPLHSQQPRIVPGGGLQRLVTSKEFPISSTMSGSILELQPGALREMHWHPNADEWQYFISGQLRCRFSLQNLPALQSNSMQEMLVTSQWEPDITSKIQAIQFAEF